MNIAGWARREGARRCWGRRGARRVGRECRAVVLLVPPVLRVVSPHLPLTAPQPPRLIFQSDHDELAAAVDEGTAVRPLSPGGGGPACLEGKRGDTRLQTAELLAGQAPPAPAPTRWGLACFRASQNWTPVCARSRPCSPLAFATGCPRVWFSIPVPGEPETA